MFAETRNTRINAGNIVNDSSEVESECSFQKPELATRLKKLTKSNKDLYSLRRVHNSDLCHITLSHWSLLNVLQSTINFVDIATKTLSGKIGYFYVVIINASH